MLSALAGPGGLLDNDDVNLEDLISNVANVANAFRKDILVSLDQLLGANLYTDSIVEHLIGVIRDKSELALPIPDTAVNCVRLRDGRIFGLDTLRRAGEAQMHIDKGGATFSGALAMDKVKLVYRYKTKVLCWRLEGELVVSVSEIETYMRLHQSIDISKSPKLCEFSIREMRGLQSSVTHLGVMGCLVKLVQSLYMWCWRPQLNTLLEEMVFELIQEELDSFKLSDVKMMRALT